MKQWYAVQETPDDDWDWGSYDFSETYFWDGTWDAVESDVTEVEV